MPRIYVAQRTDNGSENRLVSGSRTIIKQRVKEADSGPGSMWKVSTYEFKPSVENICALIENFEEFKAVATENYKVTEGGQVRSV